MNTFIDDLKVTYRPVPELLPRARNPRTHSRKQLRQIAGSIDEFGFTTPILVDADGCVIAGHGRIKAAQLLGLHEVPTIRLDHLSKAQVQAYVIADNRLAELAGWDEEVLAAELLELSELDLDFDLTITGFDASQIDLIIEHTDQAELDAADEVESPDLDQPTTSRPGDLWLAGDGRVLCGDARDPVQFRKLLGRRRARMVFTDPPYNVRIDGHVCGSGAVQHREFAMAAGEMSPQEYTDFLTDTLGNSVRFSVDGSLHYVCTDWRHTRELSSAGLDAYSELKNICVWNKDNGGMGSLYRSKHELIYVYKKGRKAHINNVALGRFGRHRTNVWDYPGVNSLRKGRRDDLAMHPTVKPVALVADAIRDASNNGGLVLDCFGGSGTTLIAAEKVGRCGYLMELDPAYVDVTLTRYQKVCGQEAVLEETGQSFAEVARARAGKKSNPGPKRAGRRSAS